MWHISHLAEVNASYSIDNLIWYNYIFYIHADGWLKKLELFEDFGPQILSFSINPFETGNTLLCRWAFELVKYSGFFT